MRRHSIWLVLGLGAGAVVVATAGGMGCSSSSGSALTPVPPGGGNKPDAAPAGNGDSGGVTLSDSGSGPPPAMDSGMSATTLYTRLGGHAGIRSAVNAIVNQELMDPNLGSYFVFQAGAPANQHPTLDQIEECFTDFIGSQKAVGGPETYPTTVTADGGMWACRTMATAHASFGISGGTFDAFVAIAGEVLQENGVSNDDLTTLASLLESTKPQVVSAGSYDAGEAPYDAAP